MKADQVQGNRAKAGDKPKTSAASKLRSLDLCTGAGGLALGIARAGFDHVAVMDSDRVCCETLRSNKERKVRPVSEWNIQEQDISTFNFSQYAGIDLLSGGPPCQPFSQAGSRTGRSDNRNMFPYFIRAVRQCEPKAFIIENVKGLLDGKLINYFNYVVSQLRFPAVQRKKSEKWTDHRARLERLYTGRKYKQIHYKVLWQVLDATNFGVAQRRRRVFIVGVRADIEVEYCFPVPTHTHEALWSDQWVNHSYWERHCIPRKRRPEPPPYVNKRLSGLVLGPTARPWRTVRDEISDLPKLRSGETSHKILNHFLNPGARVYDGHVGSHMDAPAKTIKAGHNGVPGGENMLQLDDGRVRYLSVRECARLQTFPDDWIFEGSWCGSMRQLGNAVPVTLAEAVAAPLGRALSAKSL